MKENILEPLRQHCVDIDSIILDPDNARLHPERNLETIKSSLVKHGQHRLAVCQKTDSGDIVRIGNGMVEAARLLGWKQIAAISVDEDEYMALSRALADNKTSDLSIFDYSLLNIQLKYLDDHGIDIKEIGFELSDLEEWNSDIGSTDNIEPNLEGIKSVIKVVCEQESKDMIVEKIKNMITENGFVGVEIE